MLGFDDSANHDAYGQSVTARQILVDHSVTAPAAAQSFMAAVRTEGNAAAGGR